MIFNVCSLAEIEAALAKIQDNAAHACAALRELPADPVYALARLKFDPVGCHPLERRPLNIVEQVNQTFSYLVALKAARLMLEWHPEAEGFRLGPARMRRSALSMWKASRLASSARKPSQRSGPRTTGSSRATW